MSNTATESLKKAPGNPVVASKTKDWGIAGDPVSANPGAFSTQIKDRKWVFTIRHFLGYNRRSIDHLDLLNSKHYRGLRCE